MNEEEARKRLDEEPDFVNAKRYDYSLAQLEERYPDGAPDNIIANAMMIEEEEVETTYGRLVDKFRDLMGVDG
jgi:hypothetical protein